MKPEAILVIVFEIISILALIFLLIVGSEENDGEPEVCVEETCFVVEIADDLESRSQGLMFRENLGENDGMLFIFPKSGNYNFWMRNTFIPLDIIWMNGEGDVVYIEKDAQPCTDICIPVDPGIEAKYVLEINANKSQEVGISLGKRLDIRN